MQPLHDFLLEHSFNPRSREGSDARVVLGISLSSGFNPRSREGSDTTIASSAGTSLGFNPRSREGSDCSRTRLHFTVCQFQSTLP